MFLQIMCAMGKIHQNQVWQPEAESMVRMFTSGLWRLVPQLLTVVGTHHIISVFKPR